MKRFAPFEDRRDAGRRFAAALEREQTPGRARAAAWQVPVGFEVAEALKAPE